MDQPLWGNWEQGEEGREGGQMFLAGMGLVGAICWTHLHWHIYQGTVRRSWSGRAPSGTHPAPLGDRHCPWGTGFPYAFAQLLGHRQCQRPAAAADSGKATLCFLTPGSTTFSPQACAGEALISPEQMPSTGTSS